MADRDRLYEQFGPKLVEAIALVALTEINSLRTLHGLPTFSKQDLTEAITAYLQTIEDYDWSVRL